MCLIVFAWRPEHAQPLIVAANRDEFYARPSQAAALWPESPQIIAGRDLQVGGTWLGIGANRRFAALTNIRNPRQALGPRSRGELVSNYLRGESSAELYLQHLRSQSHCYSGFNLLLGDAQSLWHFNSQSGHIRCLEAGVYGVSNADLDTPWPKLLQAKHDLNQCLNAPSVEAIFSLLSKPTQAADSQLPNTGVGLATERLLSSAFIASEAYGTRASTRLVVHANGLREFTERSFANNGQFIGQAHLET